MPLTAVFVCVSSVYCFHVIHPHARPVRCLSGVYLISAADWYFLVQLVLIAKKRLVLQHIADVFYCLGIIFPGIIVECILSFYCVHRRGFLESCLKICDIVQDLGLISLYLC